MALTQTRLAKVSNFADDKIDLSPSVRIRMAISYGSKINTYYKDESTHLRDL